MQISPKLVSEVPKWLFANIVSFKLWQDDEQTITWTNDEWIHASLGHSEVITTTVKPLV